MSSLLFILINVVAYSSILILSGFDWKNWRYWVILVLLIAVHMSGYIEGDLSNK